MRLARRRHGAVSARFGLPKHGESSKSSHQVGDLLLNIRVVDDDQRGMISGRGDGPRRFAMDEVPASDLQVEGGARSFPWRSVIRHDPGAIVVAINSITGVVSGAGRAFGSVRERARSSSD